MERRATAAESSEDVRPGFATAAVLVGTAFAGAATVGTLSTVGPYLLDISGLIGALFVLSRWTR